MPPANNVICGDNIEVMSTFTDSCIDLCVTSPPYSELRTYGSSSGKAADLWDFEGVAQQLYRVTKTGGVVVWVVSDQTIDGSETGESFRQALYFKSIGFNIHDTMFYKTNKPPKVAKRYTDSLEFMFVFSKGTPATWNPIMVPCKWAGVGCSPSQRSASGELVPSERRIIKETKPHDNIWHYETGSGKTESYGHPATFPLRLASDQIVSWSNEGDIVLDPFAGSGTTLEAAKRSGRKYIGIEVNPAYVSICKTRLSQRELF